MHLVVFEVWPAEGREAAYLDRAAALRPRLEANGGLLYLDRFRSDADPGKLLSLQRWAGEADIARWRADGPHRAAQAAGRRQLFRDYRLRVGPVVGPAAASGRLVAVSTAGALPGGEKFTSVYDPDRTLGLADVEAGDALRALAGDHGAALTLAAVARDYGPGRRAEAPPDAAREGA